MSEPDDLDEDAGLRSMRSVWREMRDEEPPVRGMAELLAAARAQVAQPPVEPGWKRAWAAIAAAFRRPPVLALATVVVLIGTGLLIGRRKDPSVDGPAPATFERKELAPHEEALDKGADKAPALGSKADDDAKDVSVHAAPSPPPADPPKPPAAHAIGHAPGVTAHRVETESSGASGGLAAPPVAAETPAAPPPPPQSTTTKPDVDGVVDANASVKPSSQEGRDRTAPAQAPARRGPNKIQQCKDAAARGDCPTAKRIAGEVQREDATGYRSMAQDANVAHCLE